MTTVTPWLLTVAEVAEISRRSEQMVRRAIRDGQLQCASWQRKSYLVSRQMVADWLGCQLDDVRNLYSTRNETDTLTDEGAA